MQYQVSLIAAISNIICTVKYYESDVPFMDAMHNAFNRMLIYQTK